MYTKEKIIIDMEMLEKIKAGIKEIIILSDNKKVRKKAEELSELLEDKEIMEVKSLYERIKEKMKKTKYSNSELNVNLYLLYRNLVEEKITEEEALDTFEMYMKAEEFNK